MLNEIGSMTKQASTMPKVNVRLGYSYSILDFCVTSYLVLHKKSIFALHSPVFVVCCIGIVYAQKIKKS